MQFTLLASFAACAAVVAAESITAKATFFSAGEVGACGTLIQDTEFVVALPSSQFDASLCGEKIIITHFITNGENAVEAVVGEECVACTGNDIDLTEAAFKALASLSEGLIDVTYAPAKLEARQAQRGTSNVPGSAQ